MVPFPTEAPSRPLTRAATLAGRGRADERRRGGGVVGTLGRLAGLGRRLTVPGLALSAIVAALVGGYEAADDTGRQHPYGAPGDAWDRRRRGALDQVGAEAEKGKEEADRRRRWFEERLQREQEGLSDFMGPLMPASPRAPLVPLGDLTAAKPAAEAAAATTAGALDQVVAKVSDAFSGKAEIAVRIETTAMFAAVIEGLVKHQLEGLNLTGVGSNGKSDTNVDQHR